MYFPIGNHYFDDSSYKHDNNNVKIENNDCLICLEINDTSDNICIRIENIFYTKECLCDGWVHEYCLDIWYVKNNKCPICLCNMIKNELRENEIQDDNNNNNQGFNNYLFFYANNLYLLIKYLLLVYTFYIFIIFSCNNIENMVINKEKDVV
jgi:hypothetical protein